VLYRELQGLGFTGGIVQVQRWLRPQRERRKWSELATVRFETRPGEQAQVDYGQLKVWIGEQPQTDRLARHEAMVFGLDAPSKMEVAAGLMGPEIDKEEIDIRLARLTPQERDTFMMLIAKMDGRWVEPPAIEEGSVETTATIALSSGITAQTPQRAAPGPGVSER
jgi:hypothetical protein